MAKKKETLRQRLRAAADGELDAIVAEAQVRLSNLGAEHSIGGTSLAKMCCSSQTKTLRSQLIGHLADKAEKELVKLLAGQQSLDLGENDAD